MGLSKKSEIEIYKELELILGQSNRCIIVVISADERKQRIFFETLGMHVFKKSQIIDLSKDPLDGSSEFRQFVPTQGIDGSVVFIANIQRLAEFISENLLVEQLNYSRDLMMYREAVWVLGMTEALYLLCQRYALDFSSCISYVYRIEDERKKRNLFDGIIFRNSQVGVERFETKWDDVKYADVKEVSSLELIQIIRYWTESSGKVAVKKSKWIVTLANEVLRRVRLNDIETNALWDCEWVINAFLILGDNEKGWELNEKRYLIGKSSNIGEILEYSYEYYKARLYYARGFYEKAYHVLDSSIGYYGTKKEENISRYAIIMCFRAILKYYMKNEDEALSLLNDTQTECVNYQSSGYVLAIIQIIKGLICFETNDAYEAIRCLKEAEGIIEDFITEDFLLEADLGMIMAYIYTWNGNNEKSLMYLRKAVTIYSRKMGLVGLDDDFLDEICQRLCMKKERLLEMRWEQLLSQDRLSNDIFDSKEEKEGICN